MTDIAIELDPVSGAYDLVYQDGDLRVVGKRGDVESEKAEILQRLRQRLETARGEWSFDTSLGPDYFGLIFADEATEDAIAAHITDEITRGYRITRVLSLELRRVGRKLFVAGNVETDLGTMTFDAELSDA